jgi:hypothetical protein
LKEIPEAKFFLQEKTPGICIKQLLDGAIDAP